MKTILAPIDFSEVSETVVREAAELARGLNGRLVVLNVIQPIVPVMTDYVPPAVIQNAVELTDSAERSAARRLARIRAKLAGDVPTETLHQVGEPTSVILEQARELSAGYIVVGSHGHSALYDLVAGSVAHGVLRKAKCPVIVVPTEKKAEPTKRKPAAKAPSEIASGI